MNSNILLLVEFFSEPVTAVITALVVMAFCIGLICHATNKQPILKDYVPAFMTSLGILGTFIGIVMGLYHFDPEDIDRSIPTLLTGLKTAFCTSIVGMTGTIFFKLLTSIKFRNVEKFIEDEENDLSSAILEAIKEQSIKLEKLSQAIGSDGDNSLISQTRLLRADIIDNARGMLDKNQSIDVNVKKMLDTIGSEGEGSLVSQIKFLRSDISDKYKQHLVIFDEFRKELNKQFEIFLEKMSSAATDQLVDALRQVIQDFNAKITEQFGDNFKQLNDAVGQLLEWQKEYREQIIQLDGHYKEAVQLLEQSKDAMTIISEKSEAIPVTMQKLEELLLAQKAQVDAMEAHLVAVANARDKAVQAVPEIQKCITSMTNELKTSVNEVANDIGVTVKHFNEQTRTASDALMKSSECIVENTNFIGQSMTKVSTELVAVSDKMASEVTKNADSVVEAFRNSSLSILSETKGMVEKVQSGFTSSLIEINDVFVSESKRAIEEVISSIETLQTTLVKSVENSTSSITETSNQFVATAENLVKDTVTASQKTMEGGRQQIETAVEQIAQTTHDQINSQIRHLDEAMTRELNSALSNLGSALATIANTIADRFEESTNRGR